MVKLLHFADAHIDIAAHGRHDPESGLPVRVLDFLRALDTIVDAAITEKVDLVIFAGDAYKDRTPAPTFQREWGKRIMRLSNAGIVTLLLVGNHDVSPASGRATTLQEFDTLSVPHVHVIDRPVLLTPSDLEGLPVQVIGIPWIYRSNLMASTNMSGEKPNVIAEELELRVDDFIKDCFKHLDDSIPVILTAHGSIQGAKMGIEQTINLGRDLVLPGGIVKDPILDYVALGHLHIFQDLNKGQHPPVIYSGSMERIDISERKDKKGFIVASVEKGKTNYRFEEISGRSFIKKEVAISVDDDLMEKVLAAIPEENLLRGSILRIIIKYPRNMDYLIEEGIIRDRCSSTLEFSLIRKPLEEARKRLNFDSSISSFSPMDLFTAYWNTTHRDVSSLKNIEPLARDIISTVENSSQSGEG